MFRQVRAKSEPIMPRVVPDKTEPDKTVPNKTVLTVLIKCNNSVFIIATPSTQPEIIDNFWLPSTIISGPTTPSKLSRKARELAMAWTGLAHEDLCVEHPIVMEAKMPYPLTAPGTKANGVLYNTVFVKVKFGRELRDSLGGRPDQFVARPHQDLLKAAFEDDDLQFRGSWLSRENVLEACVEDMEVMRPVRRVLGIGEKAP